MTGITEKRINIEEVSGGWIVQINYQTHTPHCHYHNERHVFTERSLMTDFVTEKA